MKKRFLSLILTSVMLLSLLGCGSKPATPAPPPTQSDESASSFSIRFIDVGQADAALIECDGHYMLIDGGNKGDSNLVYSVLSKAGVQHLDILVGTHAHEDHYAGFATNETTDSLFDIYEVGTLIEFAQTNKDESNKMHANYLRERKVLLFGHNIWLILFFCLHLYD